MMCVSCPGQTLLMQNINEHKRKMEGNLVNQQLHSLLPEIELL
jgi:hypothetical protein